MLTPAELATVSLAWEAATREAGLDMEQLARQKPRLTRQALVLFHANKRRAARLKRTPRWADLAAIQEVYVAARRLSEETGIQYHVDHIIPLQGDRVSGLHVANNLQILTSSENSRKRNSYEVE